MSTTTDKPSDYKHASRRTPQQKSTLAEEFSRRTPQQKNLADERISRQNTSAEKPFRQTAQQTNFLGNEHVSKRTLQQTNPSTDEHLSSKHNLVTSEQTATNLFQCEVNNATVVLKQSKHTNLATARTTKHIQQ